MIKTKKMVFLKFLLIAFLIALLLIFVLAFKIFSTFNRTRKQFQRMGRQRREEMNRGEGKQEVIDKRTPLEANRKIIDDGEGEYVDFEEEK